MNIKLYKNDPEKINEIEAFNGGKLLEMNTLCRVATRLKQMKESEDVKSKIAKLKTKAPKEDDLFNQLFKEDNYKIIPIYAKNNKCTGCVFINNKEVTIAYRGTQNWHDFIRDLNIGKILSCVTVEGKAHKGFYKATMESFNSLCDILKTEEILKTVDSEISDTDTVIIDYKINKDYRINVIGHSLGGAKAIDTALQLTNIGCKNIYVVTFGSPKCLTHTASEEYDKVLGNRTLRIKNSKDIIPWLPPKAFGYHNVGQVLRMKSQSSNPIKEHSLKTYSKNIIECKEKGWKGVQQGHETLSRKEVESVKALDPRVVDTFIKQKVENNNKKNIQEVKVEQISKQKIRD